METQLEKIVGDSQISPALCFCALFTPTCWSEGLGQWLEFFVDQMSGCFLRVKNTPHIFVYVGIGARNGCVGFLRLSCKMGWLPASPPPVSPAAL